MATTLRLTKTVTGGTAIPANWLLTATGPTTISANGDTGVQTVTAGTYELSESGSPFGYVASAWNCGGAIMPSPTSVIVDASGSPVVRPIQVAPVATYRQLLSGNPSYFEVGTDLYQLLYSGTAIGMFKRAVSDVGGTWIEQDAGGSPGRGIQTGIGSASLNGTIIAVCYLTTSGSIPNAFLTICEYDTATDTWGTPTAPIILPSAMQQFVFVQRSDLTYVVVGCYALRIYAITNTSGVWSSINYIRNPGGLILNQGWIDASDNIWFRMQPEEFIFDFTSNSSPLCRVSSSYVFSQFPTSAQIFAGVTAGAVRALLSPSPYSYSHFPATILWGGTTIATAYFAPDNNLHVLIGTTLAVPGTDYTVYTPAAGEQISYYYLAEGLDGSLNLFFVRSTSAPLNRVVQSVFDGVSAWSAPTTFYDAIVNPPQNGIAAANQVISSINAIELAAGWTAAPILETLQPSKVLTGEFLESVTPTGDVVCTITNTFTNQPSPGGQPYPLACIIYDNNPGGTPTFVAYDEPQELQGS
jgi:hypothetical protein